MRESGSLLDSPLLEREGNVLILIDIQDKLIPAIKNGQEVVKNVVRLLKFSQIIKLPVMLVKQRKLGEIVSPVREEISRVEAVEKSTFDCFRSQPFVERLAEFKAETLILVGIEAHICVMQTALHACSNYDVHVVKDAVSSRKLKDRDVGLARMRAEGVTVTSTETLIFELLGEAGTEEFERTLPLVK